MPDALGDHCPVYQCMKAPAILWSECSVRLWGGGAVLEPLWGPCLLCAFQSWAPAPGLHIQNTVLSLQTLEPSSSPSTEDALGTDQSAVSGPLSASSSELPCTAGHCRPSTRAGSVLCRFLWRENIEGVCEAWEEAEAPGSKTDPAAWAGLAAGFHFLAGKQTKVCCRWGCL